MLVYRITKAIYANRLTASGGAARWNRAGQLYRREITDAKALALDRAQQNEKILADYNELLANSIQRDSPDNSYPDPLVDLLKVLRDERDKIKKVAVPTLDGILLLPVADVVRLEAFGNYTTLYLSNGKKIVASRVLGEFESMLDHPAFFRTHKSHIVNLNFVERYIRGEGGSVILQDGSEIGVSRTAKTALLDQLAIR